MKQFLIIATLVSTLSLVTCTKEKVTPYATPDPSAGACDSLSTTFSAVIQPIFISNCTTSGCHDGSPVGQSPSLSSYDNIKSVVDNGNYETYVKKYDLIPMPPKNKLPDSILTKIDCWVKKGTNNN